MGNNSNGPCCSIEKVYAKAVARALQRGRRARLVREDPLLADVA
jgi:hypothetical protein